LVCFGFSFESLELKDICFLFLLNDVRKTMRSSMPRTIFGFRHCHSSSE